MKKIWILISIILTFSLLSETYNIRINPKNKNFFNSLKIEVSSFAYGLNCVEGVLDESTDTCINTLTMNRDELCPVAYINNGDGTCTGTSYIAADQNCSRGVDIGTGCRYTQTRSVNRSCPSGYYSYNSQCYRISNISVQCPSGYTLADWTPQCYNGSNYVSYTCPSGYIADSQYHCLTANDTRDYNESCPSGYSLSGGRCERNIVENYIYSCSTGSLSGNQCAVSETVSVSIESCPSGWTEIDSEICERIEISQPEIVCPAEAPNYNPSIDACVK